VRFKFSGLVFFVVGVAVNLVGCGAIAPATTGVASGPEAVSRIVLERAQQRWNALLKADMATAYQFISPGGRSLMTAEQYRPRVNATFWRGAKAEKASCEAETCDVSVLVDVFVEGIKTTVPVKETWILDAGKWWFVYQG
jgi:hypothetical protein